MKYLKNKMQLLLSWI